MTPRAKRNLAIGGGVAGTAVGLLIAFWPRSSDAKDAPQPKPDGKPAPPYPLPRPYRASKQPCYRTGEPYNAAIVETPEQASALLYWLGFPVGVVELLQADALQKTPIWSASSGYTPKASTKLKSFQAAARSLNLPGHVKVGVSAIDGVWGECTALSLDAAAAMQEAGTWPYKPVTAELRAGIG